MSRRTSITAALDCRCFGAQPYDLRGWNAVGKPVVACRECGEAVTAPIGAMESDPRVRARREAHLATDGGRQ